LSYADKTLDLGQPKPTLPFVDQMSILRRVSNQKTRRVEPDELDNISVALAWRVRFTATLVQFWTPMALV